MTTTDPSSAGGVRRRMYLAAILIPGWLGLCVLAGMALRYVQPGWMAEGLRTFFNVGIFFIGWRIWMSIGPPMKPAGAWPLRFSESLELKAGQLVRRWKDGDGKHVEESQALGEATKIVEWVGEEGTFQEIYWRDGSRWLMGCRPDLPKFWQRAGLGVLVERRGSVLREA